MRSPVPLAILLPPGPAPPDQIMYSADDPQDEMVASNSPQDTMMTSNSQQEEKGTLDGLCGALIDSNNPLDEQTDG